jgi:hypothetical protein
MKLLFVIAFVFWTCLGNTVHSQSLSPQTKERLLNGSLRLENSIFNTFGTGSDELRNLLDSKQWEELASKVLSKGFISNIYYYLLGRSAEGLGAIEAAKVYYRLATSKVYDCKTYMFGERCLGIDISNDVQVRITALEGTGGTAKSNDKTAADATTNQASFVSLPRTSSRLPEGTGKVVGFTLLNERVVPISGATIKAAFQNRLERGENYCSTQNMRIDEQIDCVTDKDGVCYIDAPLFKSSFSNRGMCGKIIEVTLASGVKIPREPNHIALWQSFGGAESLNKPLIYRVYTDETSSLRATSRAIPKLDQVVGSVSIQDDQLDPSIKVNTQKTRSLWTQDSEISDITFLRAWINKKSKTRTFQVYSHVDYEGEWRFYSSVNYQTPKGLESRELLKINSKVYNWGGSLRKYEDVGFDIDEATLRSISGSYIEGSDATFDFKLVGRTGRDKIFRLPVFEIWAMLNVVDKFQNTTPQNQTVNPSPTPSGPLEKSSAQERLQKIKTLLDQGLISKEEYDEKRAEILRTL